MSSKAIYVYRGDTCVLSIALASGWLGSHFSEVWLTVRDSEPADTVLDDSDVLAQVTKTGGGIVFNGATGTATIAASVTALWPTGSAAGSLRRLYFDVQGVVASTGQIWTLDSGNIFVRKDITRTAVAPPDPWVDEDSDPWRDENGQAWTV